MSRRFHRRETVAHALRAAAQHEIAAARRAASTSAGHEAQAVHDIRRQLKRLRALIRLAGHEFPGYRRENRAFRDLGRRLAGAREAEVLAASFDSMAARANLEAPGELRAGVIAAGAHTELGARLPEILSKKVVPGLAAAADRVAEWRFEQKGFALVGAGIGRTYRRMRQAGLEARLHTDAVHLHEWRKQVRHHLAQLDLLMAMAPDVLAARRQLADQLADLLGEHHDLDQLRAALGACDAASAGQRAQFLAAIEARAAELEAAAFPIGDELGADEPKELELRLAAHWRAWRR